MWNNSVVAELKKVVGWQNFWDLTEIPALSAPLNITETGQYYQSFHAAVRLDYITSLLPPNYALNTYLDTVTTESITQLLNRVETEKQIGNVGRDIATNDVVLSVGRKTAPVTNMGDFCGVMFSVRSSVGIGAIINRIGLYLTSAVTNLDLYLFHSSKEQAVAVYQFTTTNNNSFSWKEQRIEMNYDDGTNTGGTWFLGYYQTDLAAQSTQAVAFTSMNWLNGYCNTCNGDGDNDRYQSIFTRLAMQGFYVPAASLPVSKSELFDPNLAVKTNTNNWGLNFNITIVCNLTQFWIDNRRTLASVIGMQVAIKVLEMMKFSSQINNIEEGVKIMIIRDLEGTSDTGQLPLWQTLNNAVQALRLDEGNLNSDCLPCARKPKTTYGAIGA